MHQQPELGKAHRDRKGALLCSHFISLRSSQERSHEKAQEPIDEKAPYGDCRPTSISDSRQQLKSVWQAPLSHGRKLPERSEAEGASARDFGSSTAGEPRTNDGYFSAIHFPFATSHMRSSRARSSKPQSKEHHGTKLRNAPVKVHAAGSVLSVLRFCAA